jgi:hypothetical protein
LAVFLSGAIVLGLARWLTPDPAGVGTHIQLGLQPCAFMQWLQFPCPMCGMTTTFSLMAHFRPIDALINQPFGVVLFIMTASAVAIALGEIVDPKKRWIRMWEWSYGKEVSLVTGFLVGMLAAWAYKIVSMGHFFTSPA